MFKPNGRDLAIGAIMTMVGALLAVAYKSEIGVWLCGLSNIFLVWYAFTAVLEFSRNLLIDAEQSPEE